MPMLKTPLLVRFMFVTPATLSYRVAGLAVWSSKVRSVLFWHAWGPMEALCSWPDETDQLAMRVLDNGIIIVVDPL